MIVSSEEDVKILQGRLFESELPFALDTETTWAAGLADRRIIGISVSMQNEPNGTYHSFYIPLAHEIDRNMPAPLVVENCGCLPDDVFLVDRMMIGHNIKFDLQMLESIGLKYNAAHVYDTMLMHHYVDEYRPHGLKELGASLLGYAEPKAYKDAMARMRKNSDGKQEAIPAIGMAVYAEQDSNMTLELFYKLWPDFFIFDNLWKSVDLPFLLLLKQTEQAGLRINLQEAQRQSALADKRMADIRVLVGFDPAKPSQLARKLFEVPPIGLGLKQPLGGKSGRPSMNESFLASIGHPVTALVLEYRGLAKAKQAYFDSYIRLSTWEDGKEARIHPTFNQHGTLTGRLSCSDPNLQQIPRDSEIKKLFLPDEGYQLWEFDYRNIEMRLAAIYAQEETMLETFRNEGDVHQLVADNLKIERQQAKVVNFLILYGGGRNKLAQQLNCTPAKADTILSDYRESYPGLFAVAQDATDKAEMNGFVQMWSGRRRHFKYPSEWHKAFNAVIQGGAFEIVKRSGLALYEAGYDLRNQVHDSWWIQLAPGESHDKIRSIMEDWTMDSFGLRFTVDEKRLN